MITLATKENIIRGYVQKSIDLKEKFLLLNHDNVHVSANECIKTIEDREGIMRKRFETMIQYKIKTFFDEAPSASNE